MASAQVRYSAADRRRQIIDAALELFALQGFKGTTTRQIAERAKVNEAIIFRHFPTKDDLYWAVIEHKRHCSGAGQPLDEKLGEYANDRDAFAAVAEEMLERRANDTTLSRLLLYTALENHRLSQRFFRTYVAQYFEGLADYIRHGIAEGRFRDVDPMLAARGFLGMVVYHSWIQELFGWKRYEKISNHEAGLILSDLWLNGMILGDETETEPHLPKSNYRGKKNQNGTTA